MGRGHDAIVLQILLFRSLFRNSRAEMRGGPRLAFSEDKYLWLGALAFHYSFLVILLRHFRFFADPVPPVITGIASLENASIASRSRSAGFQPLVEKVGSSLRETKNTDDSAPTGGNRSTGRSGASIASIACRRPSTTTAPYPRASRSRSSAAV